MTIPIGRLYEIIAESLGIQLNSDLTRPELLKKIGVELLTRKGRVDEVITTILQLQQEEPEYRLTDFTQALLDCPQTAAVHDFVLENELRALHRKAKSENKTESDKLADPALPLSEAIQLAEKLGCTIERKGYHYKFSKTLPNGNSWWVKREIAGSNLEKPEKNSPPYR